MNDWSNAEQHFEKAHEHYEAGRWDEAESELREALALNPNRPEWHFNLGLTLEAAGKFEEALIAFRDAHTLDPEDAHAPLAIGMNLIRVDRAGEAMNWLEQAARLDPENADPHIHAVEACALLADHERAETEFYLARQGDLTPGQEALAYFNIADSLSQRGQHERAIWCLREAAHLDPTLPRVYARLAAEHAATGRQERARQLYLQELREHPGCIDTLLDMGELLVDMNRLAEAGEKVRRVLEIETDNADAHFALADLAARQGRDAEAIATLQVVLRLDPDHPEARRRLASLLLRRGDTDGARVAALDDLVRLKSSGEDCEPEDLADLGRLLLDVGEPEQAIPVYDSLVRAEANASAWRHERSVALFRAGRVEDGLQDCRTALRMEPTHAAALHNMALAHMQKRRLRLADHWIRRALDAHPEDGSLRRLRTMIRLLRAREWAQAAVVVARLGLIRVGAALGLVRLRGA